MARKVRAWAPAGLCGVAQPLQQPRSHPRFAQFSLRMLLSSPTCLSYELSPGDSAERGASHLAASVSPVCPDPAALAAILLELMAQLGSRAPVWSRTGLRCLAPPVSLLCGVRGGWIVVPSTHLGAGLGAAAGALLGTVCWWAPRAGVRAGGAPGGTFRWSKGSLEAALPPPEPVLYPVSLVPKSTSREGLGAHKQTFQSCFSFSFFFFSATVQRIRHCDTNAGFGTANKNGCGSALLKIALSHVFHSSPFIAFQI